MTISVSIVTYKSDLTILSDVLDSILNSAKFACLNQDDIYVDIINNCYQEPVSSDFIVMTRKRLEPYKINFIETKKNLGYGAGNNVSINNSKAQYHLVLNPDAVLSINFFKDAIAYLQHDHNVGLLCPKILSFDDEHLFQCKRNPSIFDSFLRSFAPSFIKVFFKNRMQLYEMRDYDYSSIIEPVPYPSGCCMFFRKSVLAKIHGFDERFFLHFEDADIGRRVNQVSKTVYFPKVFIKHKWTRGSHTDLKQCFATIKSAWLYYRIWGGFWNHTI